MPGEVFYGFTRLDPSRGHVRWERPLRFDRWERPVRSHSALMRQRQRQSQGKGKGKGKANSTGDSSSTTAVAAQHRGPQSRRRWTAIAAHSSTHAPQRSTELLFSPTSAIGPDLHDQGKGKGKANSTGAASDNTFTAVAEWPCRAPSNACCSYSVPATALLHVPFDC